MLLSNKHPKQAEAAVSTRKTFHNRSVRLHRLLTGTSHGNTVSSYVFPTLASLPAEALSPFLRPPGLENAPEIYARLQNLRCEDNLLFKRIIVSSFCWCCQVINTATKVWLYVQQWLLAERGHGKENATTAANLFLRPAIGRTSCPITETYRKYPTNRPHPHVASQ